MPHIVCNQPSYDGRWPIQAVFWLEWGSFTAGHNVPAALSRFLAAYSHSISTVPAQPVAYWRKLLHSQSSAFQSPRHEVSLRRRNAPLKPKNGLSGPPIVLMGKRKTVHFPLHPPTNSISEESSWSRGRLLMRARNRLSKETAARRATQPGQACQRQNQPVSVAPALPPR